MKYSAIAAVRNRLGHPRAVYVSDSVRIGDVVKFLDDNNIDSTQYETLGFVHAILPIDATGAVEQFVSVLGRKIHESTTVWHPEHCGE